MSFVKAKMKGRNKERSLFLELISRSSRDDGSGMSAIVGDKRLLNFRVRERYTKVDELWGRGFWGFGILKGKSP